MTNPESESQLVQMDETRVLHRLYRRIRFAHGTRETETWWLGSTVSGHQNYASHTQQPAYIHTYITKKKRTPKTVSYRATELRLSGQAKLESDRIEAENEMTASTRFSAAEAASSNKIQHALRLGSSLCHMISRSRPDANRQRFLQQGRARSRISFSTPARGVVNSVAT